MKTFKPTPVAPTIKRNATALDRYSDEPLYRQLSNRLRKWIQAGQWSETTPFLTEVEIAEIWAISPYTVRQALSLLVDESLLVRERGRGTFVRPSANNESSDVIKFNRIAVVMPWDRESFFSRMFIDVEQTAHQSGYHTMLVNHWNDADIEIERVREVVEHGVDGLIWMCSADGPKPTALRYAREKAKAVVLVDRIPHGMENQTSLVAVDNHNGMACIVKHLIDQGHRKIAMASAQRHFDSTKDREHGYHKVMTQAGINVPDDWIFGTRSIGLKAGDILAQKILRNPVQFDAICCSTDSVAVGLIQVLEKHGIHVPDDIAVTGFDDDPICSMFRPALTTVHMELQTVALEAVRLLLNQIELACQHKTVPISKICVPVKLVVRDSA